MEILRILVSGTDAELEHFAYDAADWTNLIERRGSTISFTVLGDFRDDVLQAAIRSNVTVQEFDVDKDEWVVKVQGSHAGWFKRDQK